MKHLSPLRYPGGKASFADFLSRTLRENDLHGCDYLEPFAGGGGAALRLLYEDAISTLYLNDLDPSIYTFWKAVLEEPDRFAEKILSTSISVKEWEKQWTIFRRMELASFNLGFATFYLNRCNRSGILRGAGPIGGFSQTGRWKIDARFNRKNLIKRIYLIARQRDRIEISNKNALDFLTEHWKKKNPLKKLFTYLDPPYYTKGNRLYFNTLSKPSDHAQLAQYVQRNKVQCWAISYDYGEHIQTMFQENHCRISRISPRYSLQQKKSGKEVLITPSHLRIPDLPWIDSHCHEHVHDGERK